MCRLALGDDDKRVRDWLGEELHQLGCSVQVDQMGNMFGIRKGKKKGYPVAMGSHLDTQPTGEFPAVLCPFVTKGTLSAYNRWSI